MKHNTYNARYILSFAVSFLLHYSVVAETGKYTIRNFTPVEYKAGIQNIDFAQNRDMTLFVANNLGVLAFNGNEWETHGFKTGKKKRSLAFDENTNRLYVGSQGEFGFYEKSWQYVSLLEKIPGNARDFDEVWDVLISGSNVYFCTFQAIYVYNGQSISVVEHDAGFNRSFQAGGKIFTQTQNGPLMEIKGQQLIPRISRNQNSQVIAGIVPAEDGFLLFYNSGKIELSTAFGASRKFNALIKRLEGKYVNHVLQLSDTRLAISTQTSGLFLYDLQSQSIENLTTLEGLQTNACLRTFQDYNGNLWVGMQNGIALIDINSPMRLINREVNIQGSGYEAYETEEGAYFTTSNGIYFLAKNTAKSVFLPGTEGPAYGMQEITGKLYAGHHTGLFLLEKGRAKKVAETDGLWQVKQLRSNPGFAIGGTYSGLYLFRANENMELQGVQKISGFNESSRFFEEDSKGRIWVGQFYKGLYRLELRDDLKAASPIMVSEEYDAPIDDQVILSEIDNELYIATKAGIYKIDPTTDRIIKASLFEKNIGKQPVYLLVQDQQNNIHVYAENLVGFYKQISANNYIFMPSSLYQLRYSFNNDLLNVSVNVENGVMFNANEGFIHYNPEQEDRVAINKPLMVSSLYSVAEDSLLYARRPFEKANEKPIQLEIGQKSKVLQFYIESFEFQNMNIKQFRYYLKGLDEDYGEWTNATTKEYTNLKEGNYEFTVQARNYLGQTVSSKPILLAVKPPLHRSLPAKILYAVLGLSTLILVSRFQKRRYKQKAQKLEKDKQLELAKKQQKLVEIEQQKEQELLQLEEEKIKSELRHLNKLLAASTMNLVVKNEFIETIKEKLNDLKRKGKNKETRQAIVQIIKEIDITLKLQEDWEQFTHHFDQVHGDFSTRLREEFTDLTPNEQKLCAFLRLNLNTKEIANLMGISQRGVEVARYRLRKKLGLEKGQNLSKFILEY